MPDAVYGDYMEWLYANNITYLKMRWHAQNRACVKGKNVNRENEICAYVYKIVVFDTRCLGISKL